MDDQEFEKRVEDEARAARGRYRAHDGMAEDSWLAAVRPLVARVVELEQSKDGTGLSVAGVDAIRRVLSAAPEEGTLHAAERVVRARRYAEERIRELEGIVKHGDAADEVVRRELGAASDEGTLDAAIRVVRERDAVHAALDEAGILRADASEPLLRRVQRMIADANTESERTLAAEEALDTARSELAREIEARRAADARIETLESLLAETRGERDEMRRTRDRFEAALRDERAGRLRAEGELKDAEAGLRAVSRMADRARVEVVS